MLKLVKGKKSWDDDAKPLLDTNIFRLSGTTYGADKGMGATNACGKCSSLVQEEEEEEGLTEDQTKNETKKDLSNVKITLGGAVVMEETELGARRRKSSSLVRTGVSTVSQFHAFYCALRNTHQGGKLAT